MPIDAEWNADERLWVLTPGETFEIAEVLDLMRDTDWLGAQRFLWDVRNLVEGPNTSGDLRTILGEVQRLAHLWDNSRAAIVAVTDLHFGIARMFMAFAEDLDVEYQVFRDVSQARAWLNE